MCLFDNKRFRVTFKRIPIYKVVEVMDSGNLRSPYVPFLIEHNTVANFQKLFPEESKEDNGQTLYRFDKGYIHAYTSAGEAAICRWSFDLSSLFYNNNRTRVYKTIKGYIPRFTRYAVDCNTAEICARRMIFPEL